MMDFIVYIRHVVDADLFYPDHWIQVILMKFCVVTHFIQIK